MEQAAESKEKNEELLPRMQLRGQGAVTELLAEPIAGTTNFRQCCFGTELQGKGGKGQGSNVIQGKDSLS